VDIKYFLDRITTLMLDARAELSVAKKQFDGQELFTDTALEVVAEQL
jgi:hypothetical protein